MTAITPVTTGAEIAEARDLLREYTAWALALTAHLELAPTFEGLEDELARLPGPYALPRGQLLLARHDEQPAGCVALKPLGPTTGELKRL